MSRETLRLLLEAQEELKESWTYCLRLHRRVQVTRDMRCTLPDKPMLCRGCVFNGFGRRE